MERKRKKITLKWNVNLDTNRGYKHMYTHCVHSIPSPQDSPAGVVETDIELLVHGSDVEDAMIAVEGRG